MKPSNVPGGGTYHGTLSNVPPLYVPWYIPWYVPPPGTLLPTLRVLPVLLPITFKIKVKNLSSAISVRGSSERRGQKRSLPAEQGVQFGGHS